jgi:hypothetical protein
LSVKRIRLRKICCKSDPTVEKADHGKYHEQWKHRALGLAERLQAKDPNITYAKIHAADTRISQRQRLLIVGKKTLPTIWVQGNESDEIQP